MSSTDPSIDSLSASLASQWNPHAAKPGTNDKPGTGKAAQTIGLLTPEGTPEIDDDRIEAEKRRQAKLEAVEPAKKSSESQPPKNHELQPSTKTKDDGTDDEAAKQAEILKEILSCSQDGYHKILGIKEDYDNATEEMAAVESAVYNRGIEIHPKYNKDENAEKAWNMVRTAGDELGCRESVYQEVMDFGDEDPDALEDSASSMEGLEMETPKPTKIVLRWYEEATPLMDQLQQNPKSFSVKRKLDAINDKIKRQNEEEEQKDANMWLIDYKAIAEFYSDVRPFVDRLKGDANDQEALEGARKVEKDLNDYLDSNQYPGAWTFKVGLLMQEAVKEKTEEAKKKMKNDMEERRKKRMEERKNEKAAEKESIETEQPEKSSPAIVEDWRPGLTMKAEEIYAMQPYERTSKVTQEKSMDQCFFLIGKKGRRKGENSMVFEDSETIGPKATDGYLKQLPESERVDIRTEKYKYSTYDRMGYVEIDDIAIKPAYSSRVYPAICIRAKFENGTYKYFNRTVFRKIWGSTRADRMIEDYYDDNGLAVPWKKRAKRPGVVDPVRAVESVKEVNSAQVTESSRRGRSTSRSLERRRSISVSSSASYLSDEGLVRLGGIEDRMDKFEKMFENLSKKLDRLQ